MVKKLIEVALPLEAISRESAREKSIRHGHPSTLHLWWARRPLAAARAVLWASLVDDPSSHPDVFPTVEDQKTERKRLFDILERLVRWENSNDQDILDEARKEIVNSVVTHTHTHTHTHTNHLKVLQNIKVLDPFCGGGTIPLEAQRLGLSAYGGDLNPVAVLISKAMVEIPPRFAGRPPVNPVSRGESGLKTWKGAQGLAEDIRYYGEWMRERAWEQIGHLYPKVDGKTVIAWLWARTVQSPDPSWKGHVPLLKSGVLRNKPGKPVIWVEPIVNRETKTIEYRVREGGTPSGGTIKRGGGYCVATGSTISKSYIHEQSLNGLMSEVCIGTVLEGAKGREYIDPNDLPYSKPRWKPEQPMDRVSTDLVSGRGYGFYIWGDCFTDRQLVALTTFSDLLSDVRKEVEQDAFSMGWVENDVRLRDGGSGVTAYVDAIHTYLGFVIDRCVDKWSTFSTWEGSREVVSHAMVRQALPMVWDFAEANPFSSSTGNWFIQVEWISRAVSQFPATLSGQVSQRDALARLTEVYRPIVCTDPPYYDNIQYANISDFFYVWLRRNVSVVWPDECATLMSPKNEELVANVWRAGSKEAAREHFESGMSNIMESLSQEHHLEYPATIFYAFKQKEIKSGETTSTGWETFLQGIVSAGLEVTATWPIRTEMANRILAKGNSALSSSVVLACRPRSVDARLETRGGFLAALREELPEAVGLLQEQAIPPVDMAQSAIGPGMRVFSRYKRVVEADGSTMRVRTALALINGVLEEILSQEETDLDADSRFALTWYRQFGHQPGPFGDAETLAKAMNTSVSGVVEAEVAESKGGKVRLLTRDELDPGWDPAEDRRLTVWELTQHLVARQGRSDAQAGVLLARAGPGLGDYARHLAYLLYEVANGAGRTEDAVAYNSLIVSWNNILQHAREAAAPVQQTL